ncbi:MAG: Sensor protein of zinc sigma-54-dependent two-component system [Polyangiaceae bacterium]|nr:Sensor protein of zinc sigma-54-dependent two-component system [Polyangiaceae bacterium]
MNVFRLITERLGRGQPLDAEDTALLREELDRLSGMGKRLRELSRWSLTRTEHTPRHLLELALASSPALSADRLELDVGAPEGVRIACDASLIGRALRELLDNALEARSHRAGARWEQGEEPCLCVWDDGDGFALEPGQAARFGVTTRAEAAGLGLTLAVRAVRAHGFRLEFSRTEGRTEARLRFVAPAGGEPSTKGAG